MFMLFMRKNQFMKFSVTIMDREDSPLSSGANIKLIVSVLGTKNATKDHYYENILVFFMNREVQGVKHQ